MINICIYGGGSLGHVCAGVLASHPDVNLRIHSRRPNEWDSTLKVTDPDGKVFNSPIAMVSDSYEATLKDCNLVLLCLPGYAIEETISHIKPYLGKGTVLGAIVGSTGFFFHAHKLLDSSTPLFAFQRTPFIARTSVYGHEANLLGYKPVVDIAVENIEDKESFRQTIERLFITPTRLLNNFYEVSLSNSNPILHTGRLYTLWKDWHGETRPECGLFYKEWTDEASQCIIDMDKEFSRVLDQLPVNKAQMPSLLDYYESHDAASLTRKISSIKAFLPILSPMKETPEGWIPDFKSRYFTEDFPCGLRFIKQVAEQHNVDTPLIDEVLQWGLSKIN